MTEYSQWPNTYVHLSITPTYMAQSMQTPFQMIEFLCLQ